MKKLIGDFTVIPTGLKITNFIDDDTKEGISTLKLENLTIDLVNKKATFKPDDTGKITLLIDEDKNVVVNLSLEF